MENEDNIFSSVALPFSSALLPLRLLQMNSAKPTLFFILYSELQEKNSSCIRSVRLNRICPGVDAVLFSSSRFLCLNSQNCVVNFSTWKNLCCQQ